MKKLLLAISLLSFFTLPLSVNATASSTTFSYTGATSTWTIPNGVTSITIDALGAKGGDSPDLSTLGGKGGEASGTLAVTAGQVFYYCVGGSGWDGHNNGVGHVGGFCGGGSSAGSTANVGGSGGGPSWFSTASSFDTTNVLVIAGGGGGGGTSAGATGGGLTGGNSSISSSCGAATGGSQSAGGGGGSPNGNSGTAGQGGNGVTAGNAGGAGGGGGLYGGGSGGSVDGNCLSGGAGGSSGLNSTLTTTSTNAGVNNATGSIRLTYNIAPAGHIKLSTSTYSFSNSNPTSTETITNDGQASSILYWTATSTQTWITFSSYSGSLNQGSSTVITVSSNGWGFLAGTYISTTTIADPNATNTPQLAGVTMVVSGAAAASTPPMAWFFQ